MKNIKDYFDFFWAHDAWEGMGYLIGFVLLIALIVNPKVTFDIIGLVIILCVLFVVGAIVVVIVGGIFFAIWNHISYEKQKNIKGKLKDFWYSIGYCLTALPVKKLKEFFSNRKYDAMRHAAEKEWGISEDCDPQRGEHHESE